MSEVLDKKIVSNMSWKFFEKILTQGISFIVTIILARIITPNEYGIIAIVNIFIIVADVIITSGFSSALIQKDNTTKDDFTTIFYFNLLISVLLYILLFIFAPLLETLYKINNLSLVIRIIALKLPLSSLYSVQSSYISHNMQFKKFFFSTLIGTLISAVVGITMAYNGYGIWALVAQQLVNLFIDTLILSFTIDWHPSRVFKKQVIKENKNFAGKLILTDLIGTIFNYLNSFLIGIKYSSEDLAYYSKGHNLPSIFDSIISTSVTTVMYPAISKIKSDKQGIKLLIQNSIKIVTYIFFPMYFGLFIISYSLVMVLYSQIWYNMIVFLRIFCISGIISLVGIFDLIVLRALGKGKKLLVLEIIKKPVFLIISLIAMYFGVVYIAYSVILVNIIALIINSIALSKEIDYNLFEKIKDISKSLLISLLMVLSVYLIGFIPITSQIIILIVKFIIGFVSYLIFSMIFRSEELKICISFIKNNINSRKGKHKIDKENTQEN